LNKEKSNVPATPVNAQIDIFSGLDALKEYRAGQGESILGLETMDRTDIKMPKIKLVQATSLEAQKGKAPAGHFLNTITGESYPYIDAHLLVLGKGRVMWKKPFKRGEDPLCRSNDGLVGIETATKNKRACETCPYRVWENKADGSNKPECNNSYTWLAVTAGQNPAPFRLLASGSSVSPTKDFLNTIAPKKYPPLVYNVRISSEQQENQSGVFYVLKYTILGVVSKETADSLSELAAGLRDMFQTAVEHDLERFADDEEEAPVGKKGLY